MKSACNLRENTMTTNNSAVLLQSVERDLRMVYAIRANHPSAAVRSAADQLISLAHDSAVAGFEAEQNGTEPEMSPEVYAQTVRTTTEYVVSLAALTLAGINETALAEAEPDQVIAAGKAWARVGA